MRTIKLQKYQHTTKPVSVPLKSLMLKNLAQNCTELVWMGFHGAPKDNVCVNFLNAFWYSELEFLQQAAEQDEKLHLGHCLSQTNTVTCKG